MLLQLIVKYFFHNRKRTFRAVAILSIGLSLVLSTDMLISGYIDQIEGFASKIDSSSDEIQIVSNYGNSNEIPFEDDDFTKLIDILDNSDLVSDYLLQYRLLMKMNISGNHYGLIEFMISDLNELVNRDRINLGTNNTAKVFISNSIPLTSEQIEISLDYNSLILNYSDLDRFTNLKGIASDVLIDSNSENIPAELVNKWNYIEVYVKNSEKVDELVDQLDSIDNISIQQQNPSNSFLRKSGNQITTILFLLQIAMSSLLILSIAYVMITLVQESEEDIRIFNMVGLERTKIFMIFQGQAILSALFACIVSFIFSIMFLYALLPFITLIGLPYGSIALNFGFTLITFSQALIVGVLAGLYPSYLGAK